MTPDIFISCLNKEFVTYIMTGLQYTFHFISYTISAVFFYELEILRDLNLLKIMMVLDHLYFQEKSFPESKVMYKALRSV